MNKVIVTICNCRDCEYCEHNGLLQDSSKWICRHHNAPKRKDPSIKYWYNYPVLGEVEKKQPIPIPDWCPMLNNEVNNDR